MDDDFFNFLYDIQILKRLRDLAMEKEATHNTRDRTTSRGDCEVVKIRSGNQCIRTNGLNALRRPHLSGFVFNRFHSPVMDAQIHQFKHREMTLAAL